MTLDTDLHEQVRPHNEDISPKSVPAKSAAAAMDGITETREGRRGNGSKSEKEPLMKVDSLTPTQERREQSLMRGSAQEHSITNKRLGKK